MRGHRGRLFAGALLAALLLALFFRGVHWGELGVAFGQARENPALLVASVLATVLTYALRAWRWGYLLAPVVHVPFGRLFSATWVGFLAGLFIPRAGEIVRPYLVARRHAIPTSAGFASIILERLVDLVTVLGLVGLYLYVLPMPEQQTRGALLEVLKRGGLLVGLGTGAVLAVLVGLHARAELVLRLLGPVLSRLPGRLGPALAEMLRSFASGLAVMRASLGHLLAIFGQSVLVWLSIALTLWTNNLAFGIDLPFHSVFLLIGFLTVGVAVPTPGMVGGFHEAFLVAMTQAFDVDKSLAAAAGISAHALSNLPVLVLGLFYLGREGLSLGKVAEIADEAPPAGPGGGGGAAPAEERR